MAFDPSTQLSVIFSGVSEGCDGTYKLVYVEGNPEGMFTWDLLTATYYTFYTVCEGLTILGFFWQVPDVIDLFFAVEYEEWVTILENQIGTGTGEVTSTPDKAINPNPANEATEVNWDKTISWEAGDEITDSYDVYFGQNGNLVSLGNQTETSKVVPYTTQEIEGITYAFVDETEIDWNIPFYWRIDAVNAAGTTTGDTWWFDARPTQVTNPTPENEATAQVLFPTYSWDASELATYYTLYVKVGDTYSITVRDLTGTSYDSAVVDFDNGRVWGWNSYYVWRVDSVNEFGICGGSNWFFYSFQLKPPKTSFITNWYPLVGGSGKGPEDDGVYGEDFLWSGENFISTIKKLVGAAQNRIWICDNI